jgi:ATP-dependent Clp protease ATP-binding subunit ClpC
MRFARLSNIYVSMFERYTEKARRVIFFARYEASQYGSPYMETEHLLLGLLREDRALAIRLLANATAESIRKRIDDSTIVRQKVSTSVDLPLSNESKRVLAYAAEEAERLFHQHIGTEHLLLGLLRERKCFAASILNDIGIDLDKGREIVKAIVADSATAAESAGGQIVAEFSTSVTRTHAVNSIEFRCGNEAIASVTLHAASTIPRIGEQVVFKNKDGEDVRYRVANVRYVYGGQPAEMARQLSLVIEIKRE